MAIYNQNEEYESFNSKDKEELLRMKAKIEENLKKITDLNNHMLELKKAEKMLQSRSEASFVEEGFEKVHSKISYLKDQCENIALSASRVMKTNNELIEKRNELLEKIKLREYIIKQAEARNQKSKKAAHRTGKEGL